MALRQSQRSAGIAQVLFQRFWFVSSLRSFTLVSIAQASVLLGAKLDEASLRLRDLVNVFDFILQRDTHAATTNPGPRQRHFQSLRERHSKTHASTSLRRESESRSKRPAQANTPPTQHPSRPFTWSPPRYQQGPYLAQKDEIIVGEMQILKRLAFRTEVMLPYNTLANYLQLLGLTDNQQFPGVAQMAWGIVNDALQTPVYCLFQAHAIACAAIYLTALYPPPGCPAQLEPGNSAQGRNSPNLPTDPSQPPHTGQSSRRIPLPYDPAPWFELLDVDESELRTICTHLLQLYNTVSPPIPPAAPSPNEEDSPEIAATKGVVGPYASDASDASDTESELGVRPAQPTTRFTEAQALNEWARLAPGVGLAARVRDEWGGMAFLARDRHVVVQYAQLFNSLGYRDEQ